MTELGSCGGCLADGTGVDCSSVAYAEGVGCDRGTCVVRACDLGRDLG